MNSSHCAASHSTAIGLTITETIYRGKLRGYGKTKGSLTTVDLPEELANQIGAWLETLEDKGPAAFLFPNATADSS